MGSRLVSLFALPAVDARAVCFVLAIDHWMTPFAELFVRVTGGLLISSL